MDVPQSPPSIQALLREVESLDPPVRRDLFLNLSPLDSKSCYLPWDEIRYRQPPDGHTRLSWWFSLATARRAAARPLPLLGTGGQPFWYSNAQPLLEALHQLDQAQSDHPIGDDTLFTRNAQRRQLNLAMIDESIQSSQLEGANTSRLLAREMLRDGRPPHTHGEQMIANNFAAMQTVEAWTGAAEPIDLPHLLELHRIVTRGTMKPDYVGRLQRPGEARVSVVSANEVVVHRPPPADELPERMQRLFDFASGASDIGFVHPIVRAILLHFMIGYDHPFVDGNGRTARALFYWSLMRSGFWLAPYLSISEFLLAAPAQYSRAYQYVTADLNDATYFILHQLDTMQRAVERLGRDLRHHAAEARIVSDRLSGADDLNERQTVIIAEALRDPTRIFTIAQQRREHGVSYWAARNDLQSLADRALLTRTRSGKKFVYRPAPDLADRLSDPAR